MARQSNESRSEDPQEQAGTAAEPNQSLRTTTRIREAIALMRRRSASLSADASGRGQHGPMLTRCAWCERVALGEGWLEPEIFEKRQIAGQGYRLTHGICPDCLAGVKADRAKRHPDR
jgi:hypothetical protein